MQMMKDPQGAAFYIIQPATTQQQPDAAPEVGEASWLELMTTDAPAAMTFYQRDLRLAAERGDGHGRHGQVPDVQPPHGMIGGMMNKPPQMAHVPPNWQIYFLRA